MIQTQFKARWTGINTEYTGKPGTSLMCNTERCFPMRQQEKEETLRSERLSRIFKTLKNIENDYPLLLPANPSDRAARSGQNFFKPGQNKTDLKDSGSLHQYLYTSQSILNQI